MQFYHHNFWFICANALLSWQLLLKYPSCNKSYLMWNMVIPIVVYSWCHATVESAYLCVFYSSIIMESFRIPLLVLICTARSLAFELPKDWSHSSLKINNNIYNVTNTYHVGEVYPTDAHYDVYGNLFYVETGRNENGYFFNVNIIKFKTTAPEKIPGKFFLLLKMLLVYAT